MKENIIKDTMYYLSKDSRTSSKLARGVTTGLIGALMGFNELSFEAACAVIRPYIPKDVNVGGIPQVWRKELLKKETKNETKNSPTFSEQKRSQNRP